jgi:nitric oxide reductase NorQ protein
MLHFTEEKLPITKQPDFYFVEIVMADKARFRLTQPQMVRVDGKEDVYVKVDNSLNIQLSREVREKSTVGSVFAIADVYLKFAETKNGGKGKSYLASATPNHLVEQSKWDEDMRSAFDNLISTGIAKSTVKGTKKSPATSTVKKKSKIDILLSRFPVPTVADDGYYVSERAWIQMLLNFELGKNTLITGSSGTGKTEIIQLFASKVGRVLKTHDMQNMEDPVSGLLGVHRINSKGVSEFDRASFTHDIEGENIILLDELSRAPSSASNLLYPVLDNRKKLSLNYASSAMSREIMVHPDARFFATANEGITYTGTSIIDQALRERFNVIVFEYLPKEIEADVLVKRTRIAKKNAELIATIADDIRQLERNEELTIGVSLRHTITASQYVSMGLEIKDAIEMTILPAFQVEEQQQVRDVISKRAGV